MKKIIIEGKIIVKTGLHIGGDSTFSAIGGIDSPVIRNAATGLPIIPGSSLKGKLRSLLAKNECGEKVDFKEESITLIRLFGGELCRARLIFSDLDILEEENRFDYTEGKWENTIDRKKINANPRQIERVIPQSVFPFKLIYNVLNEEEIVEDFELVARGLKLLQVDYLGGGGTRGNGRVVFEELNARSAKDGEYEKELKEINKKLLDVNEFGKKVYETKGN